VRHAARTVDDTRGAIGGRECTTDERECAADGTGALLRQFACPPPPFMRRRVYSGDDELVDVMAPLLRCRWRRMRAWRIGEELTRCLQCGLRASG
jgi:hypothetical protein